MRLSDVEMVIMGTEGWTPQAAQAFYQQILNILVNLASPGLLGHGTVTAELLNVRDQPGVTGNILAGLRRGAAVEVWGRTPKNNWLCVRAGDLAGWVSAAYVQA